MRMRWNREVDRAIVSGVAETEIQQIKKEYITDRIRESLNLFGNKPECMGSIIMTAVVALALVVSKVLQKARELSARLFDTETVQPPLSQQEKDIGREQPNNALTSNRETESKAQTTENKMPQIPPKPVMSAEAVAYPKLSNLPMPNIRLKPINGKNFTEKMHKNRKKKVYTDGYRIIKGKMQIGNQNQPYKEKTEERDNCF